MNESSSSASGYFWTECNQNDGKLVGASAGLLILFTTYSFEFLVGTPSNLWLISHILRKMSKISGVLPADFFPLHLALTQLSFYLVMPVLFINHFLWQSNFVLAVVTFLTSMVLIMKPLLLCLVSVQRYMAVVRPFHYQRYNAPQYRWGCLGVLWCINILITSASLVQRSSITVCVVFLPVLVIDTFCSLSVLKTLKKPPPGDRKMTEKDRKPEERRKTHKTGRQVVSEEREKQQSSQREEKVKEVGRSELRGKGEMNSTKRKAFITIVIIQAVLTLNYLPFIICLPLGELVSARALKCQYMAMALAAAASCSSLQPLLYLHRLGRLPFMTSQNT